MNIREIIEQYLKCLEKSDLGGMLSLFSENALIQSPFLGEIPASDFFPKVFGASRRSQLTLHDILENSMSSERAAAYFRYDWTLKDGSEISFECVDIFEFDSESKITQLVILYDTHPIRDTVGDKYA